ncbi:hypothetical protein THAOC_04368 [Thalassiosira oceanica]|uniref:Uncharacterized protein n=1 Tax=Thalassiosira oceanica TaxID=159749 RepID=K0TA50_THAOC|nr:hypothetical protein THAOC_04368 [Thalassiosira oceanica]|eukprot:EJK73984.1 hypothetical protein THAOC_04368 [Thalassiosira oceanica]
MGYRRGTQAGTRNCGTGILGSAWQDDLGAAAVRAASDARDLRRESSGVRDNKESRVHSMEGYLLAQVEEEEGTHYKATEWVKEIQVSCAIHTEFPAIYNVMT